MNRNALILMFFVFALASSAFAEREGFFDGGWRVSVGAAYNAPAKVGLKFSPVKFNGTQFVPQVSGQSSAQAMNTVKGTPGETPTKRYYSADKRVYVDTVDKRTGTATEGMEKGTWNVQVLEDSWDGSTFELASSDYVDVENLHDGYGALKLEGSDEAAQPGISVELSRNLYHSEEYHFGVDLAFMFSYFFRTDLYETDSTWKGDTYAVTRGTMRSTIAPQSGVFEERGRNGDGTYGIGTFNGPGVVFDYPKINDCHTTEYYGSSARFRANGDFRDLEMVFALRPYYDIFEWLRLYGTIGLAVSWSEFDLDVYSDRNGVSTSYSRDYKQWDVYGVGGLGLMLRWHDFCLGFDFFARFLHDDLDINDDIVKGSLERGGWMFRGMLGYEF